MPHPIMFSDDDPGLAELRRIALDLPGAFEKISHGRPSFCVPTMFAIYGGSMKDPGGMISVPHCVLMKVDAAERPALEQDPRFFLPAYVGPFGWLGLDFDAAPVDWDEVAELVDTSYRMTAGKKRIAELDAR
ncbi:MmcQ/YjbR family DNA-binding protein [Mycolicibacterium brumae]|uniref:Phosphoribosylglycinamide formyltransferase n=1 Tax=Mycolicibacterium brumae TaxID=85968 RepID=A0A2G5PC17_9MYCO|nr:MmcQ/YjbR family DNA-binding protein [Mycolicibacterium brumae]MCV7191377.1 MmcQ/YjbR family DNA-binding protein [Mycolicibacterium brumae]PIB75817.1 phosphoribosylglycinamide formyltransferase [Mycolicibacterium brumae]UWW09515.1 MmcQ/YjbR family DNA-binding protein [Mycolicibacterium brumae]